MRGGASQIELTNAVVDVIRPMLRKVIDVIQEEITFSFAVAAIVIVLVELQNAVLGGVDQEVDATLLLGLV